MYIYIHAYLHANINMYTCIRRFVVLGVYIYMYLYLFMYLLVLIWLFGCTHMIRISQDMFPEWEVWGLSWDLEVLILATVLPPLVHEYTKQYTEVSIVMGVALVISGENGWYPHFNGKMINGKWGNGIHDLSQIHGKWMAPLSSIQPGFSHGKNNPPVLAWGTSIRPWRGQSSSQPSKRMPRGFEHCSIV